MKQLSTNQQFVMRWNIFPKQEALHSNECLQDCGVESEIILHSEIEQRTEVSSLLELGAGGLNKCDLIYPQEAFDRYFSAKSG